MDLISREAAIDRLNAIPPGNWSKARYTRELWNVPSVPAVPLDKLCELLCGMDNKPYCDDCRRLGIECDYRKCGSPGHWKEFLTKWMEEQDAKEET